MQPGYSVTNTVMYPLIRKKSHFGCLQINYSDLKYSESELITYFCSIYHLILLYLRVYFSLNRFPYSIV